MFVWMNTPPPRLLTARESAIYLGIASLSYLKHPERSVNRMRKLGRFKGVRHAGAWFYDLKDLDAWIESAKQ